MDNTAVKLVKQELPSQYLDILKLRAKLRELFPGVKCMIEPKLEQNFTIVFAPRVLSEVRPRSDSFDEIQLAMPSEKIESLRREIYARCLTNTARKEFVPYEWLSDLLTEGRVRDALEALDDSIIDKDECPQIARDIWEFGLKTFAIFLTMKRPDLIYRFFQTDQFDKDACSILDKRLPMEEAKLQHALGLARIQTDIEKLLENANKKGGALDRDSKFKKLKEQEAECIGLCQQFMSVQDMFLSPTFPQGPLHRLLLDSTRLPFVLNSGHGETTGSGAENPPLGGFGKVSKETLPPQRYGDKLTAAPLAKQGMVIVRKELKSHSKEAYRGELRCLRLLAAARHPCLVELYGSYTYHTKHNFLFREAVQGDLHDLLEGERRLPKFQHDDVFYLAFCGLASALEQVHCYANDDLKLEMIGCHHDLKPRNVFVDDGRFILGDFGLASMKDKREDPTILAQDRDLYFAAPENIDYVEGIRGQVGPPGDIWSLGCILTEVYTFMRGGRDAVHDFRHSRVFEQDFGDIIMPIKAFHDGLGNLNPATTHHLDGMEAAVRVEAEAKVARGGWRRPVPELGLIQLVREMLTVDVSARPDIKKVLQRLRCIALQKKSEPICDELLVSPHSENAEFVIERQVFREWLGRLEEAGRRGQLHLPADAAFDDACKTLDVLLDELRLLAHDDLTFPLFSQLRRLNEQLLSCLDVAGRLSIRRAVERNAIPIARKLARESKLPPDAASTSEAALLGSGPKANILRLLAAAQVKARMGQKDGQVVPRLKSADVTLNDSPKVADNTTTTTTMFRLGTLRQDGGTVEIPVVVEEMTIDAKHAKPEYSDRLFKRLENVLSLGTADTLRDFRALNCCGIYFDMDNELIGLTYRYPPQVNSSSSSSNSSSSTRVVSLAQLLAELPDTVDYKRNLVVGVDDRARLARDLALAVANFHHIGWMHKNLRPKDETAMSSKRYHTSFELRAYHHPEYAGEGSGAGGGDREAYRPEFDYYSLGLVLLELGHWWPLRAIVPERHRRDRAALRDYVLQRSVPFLAGAVGEAYAHATEACLSRNLGGESVEEDFSRLVIAPLEEQLGTRTGAWGGDMIFTYHAAGLGCVVISPLPSPPSSTPSTSPSTGSGSPLPDGAAPESEPRFVRDGTEQLGNEDDLDRRPCPMLTFSNPRDSATYGTLPSVISTAEELLAVNEDQLVQFLNGSRTKSGGFDISRVVGVDSLSNGQREEFSGKLSAAAAKAGPLNTGELSRLLAPLVDGQDDASDTPSLSSLSPSQLQSRHARSPTTTPPPPEGNNRFETFCYEELVKAGGRPAAPVERIFRTPKDVEASRKAFAPWLDDTGLDSWDGDGDVPPLFSAQLEDWMTFRHKWQWDNRGRFAGDEGFSAFLESRRRRYLHKGEVEVVSNPSFEATARQIWKYEQRFLESSGTAGFAAYTSAVKKRLASRGFTQAFHLAEDPRQQDAWSTWVEYLDYVYCVKDNT
ncbi:hypothetical protein GQX73_g10778 [Xylaria multiplex]|uniref:Protein kinase domain-containing protein n=1 Tax=Xylaria multiplex TaxID=323545 RepID=A0A7C8MM31_9PEZI|nr:hypothetical protein GQX73_g10778 [Xylaria multiplex]